jgi:ACS family glucarate transporter-like MFS transporter
MGKRRLVVGLLGLISVITFLDRMAIAVAGPHIQKELHIGPEMWGWVLSAYVVANGIFEIPSGAIGDRYGHRWEFTRIVTWWSTFTAATAWCQNFWQLAGARFLFGLGSAGAYPNAAGVLARWLPLRERGRGQGFIWACSRFGGALAPLLLVPLQAQFGWRAVFWVLGGIGFAWSVVWAVWYRDNPAETTGVTARELEIIGAREPRDRHASPPWRKLMSRPQLWLIVAAYGCYAWASWFYFSWFPTWLVHAGGFSMAQMGLYASLPFFLGIVTNLIGGSLADRLAVRIGPERAYRAITSICLLVTSVLLLAMSFATSQVAIVGLAAVSFGCMDLMLPSAWAMCTSIGGRWGGVATGVMNTAGQAGGLLCTVLFGYVVGATNNYDLPVRVVALMVLVAAGLFSQIRCVTGALQDDEAPGAEGIAQPA